VSETKLYKVSATYVYYVAAVEGYEDDEAWRCLEHGEVSERLSWRSDCPKYVITEVGQADHLESWWADEVPFGDGLGDTRDDWSCAQWRDAGPQECQET
jgi:hypothetical protein